MHLAQLDFPTAVDWLEQHLPVGPVAADKYAAPASRKPRVSDGQPGTLRLPVPDDRMLDRVRQYLTGRRRLQASLLEPLIDSGKLVRRPARQCRLLAGGRKSPSARRGRTAWHGTASLARNGPGNLQGLRLLLDRVRRFAGNRPLRVRHRRDQLSSNPSPADLHLDVRRPSQSSLAPRSDRPRLRHPLRLRRRRSRRRCSPPNDDAAPLRQAAVAARPRLERRPRFRLTGFLTDGSTAIIKDLFSAPNAVGGGITRTERRWITLSDRHRL